MKLLVTGGAGFIGSAVVRHIIQNTPHQVLNVDKLTYAGNLESLALVENNERYQFSQTDICDRIALDQLFESFQPDAVCIWLLNRMLTAQLQALLHLLKPILLVHITCWRLLVIIGTV